MLYLQKLLIKSIYMNLIEKNKDKVIELCESHKVKELYMFGSILTPNFNDKSDIDLLIQFNDIQIDQYFDNYMDLKEKLGYLFNREIDLLENQAIKNPIFRKIIDREKKLIYVGKIA
jgi:uncharacterized protein